MAYPVPMVHFKIFGIPVTVHPFFWLTLAILGSGGLGGGTSPMALLFMGLFVLAGFISIMIHELGHALTARKFGARCQIVLQAFGGYAAYDGIPMNRLQSFCITAAGPALQIVFGLLVALVHSRMPALQPGAEHFLSVLVWISLIWAIFNLLPILPLDGGRMLQSILGPNRIGLTLWVTIVTATLLALLAFINLHGFGQLLIPLFFGMYAWQAWKALQQKRWK